MSTIQKRDSLALSALGLLALVGVLIVLLATSRYGSGLATVSGDYLAAARSILAGKGFIQHDGSPYLYYPPLFPLLLALFGLFGADVVDTARYFNAIAFGMIVFVVGVWLRRNVKFYPLAIIATLLVLFSTPVVKESAYVFPETLFSLLLLLSLFSLHRFLESTDRSKLYLSAVFVALACLTRYIGVAAIASGAVTLLLRPKAPLRAKLGDVLAFSSIATLPLAAWFLRNVIMYSTLSTERGDSIVPLAENIRNSLSTIAGWLLPRVPSAAGIAVVLILFLGIVAFAIQAYSRRREYFCGEVLPRLFPFLLLCVVHVGLQAVIAATMAVDPVGNRFLMPIYVPLFLTIVVVLDATRAQIPWRRLRGVLSAALVVLGFLHAAYSARLVVKNVRHYHAHGVGGYVGARWLESDTIASLKSNPPDGVIFSNESCAVYLFTGIHAQLTPRKTYFHSSTRPAEDLAVFRRSLDNSAVVYLVWFHDVNRPYLFDVEELRQSFELETVSEYSDGAVYRVRRSLQ